MPPACGLTFSRWLRQHRIKSLFYHGERLRNERYDPEVEPTMYGLRTNLTLGMEECVYARAPAESDLQQINARAFSWFNHFLPRVDAIDHDSAHTHFERGGDAQVIYNMEAPELIKELFTDILKTNPGVLDAAIRMCALSLTTDHWQAYLRDHAEWLQTVGERDRQRGTMYVDPETLAEAWGPEFQNRPIVLLDEPAIEVLLYQSEGFVCREWHIDNYYTSFPGDQQDSIINYGAANILLPGSRAAQDRVAIEASGRPGTWPSAEAGEEAGVFVPSNVLNRDVCLPQDRQEHAILNKKCWIIQLCANGMPAAERDSGLQHAHAHVRPIRVTLSELKRIKHFLLHNLASIRQNVPQAFLPHATRNPYAINYAARSRAPARRGARV
jgi:hypothetical protein